MLALVMTVTTTHPKLVGIRWDIICHLGCVFNFRNELYNFLHRYIFTLIKSYLFHLQEKIVFPFHDNLN